MVYFICQVNWPYITTVFHHLSCFSIGRGGGTGRTLHEFIIFRDFIELCHLEVYILLHFQGIYTTQQGTVEFSRCKHLVYNNAQLEKTVPVNFQGIIVLFYWYYFKCVYIKHLLFRKDMFQDFHWMKILQKYKPLQVKPTVVASIDENCSVLAR